MVISYHSWKTFVLHLPFADDRCAQVPALNSLVTVVVSCVQSYSDDQIKHLLESISTHYPGMAVIVGVDSSCRLSDWRLNHVTFVSM